MNAAVPRNSYGGSKLLFANDNFSGRKWLIDGGALWSIIPPTPEQRALGPNAWKLSAANGTDIACYGLSDQTVCIGDHAYEYTFIIADVQQPILGADFLSDHYLAPNHRDGTLIDLKDFSTIHVNRRSTQSEAHDSITNINLVDQKDDPFFQLLDKFPSLCDPSFKTKLLMLSRFITLTQPPYSSSLNQRTGYAFTS